jgi:LPXTG-site transpeptidase (sortase) family protein
MQNKQRYLYALVLVFVVIVIASAAWLWSRSSGGRGEATPESTKQTVTGKVTATPSPLPHGTRLLIPSLNIDAPVESVGQLEDGAMGVPTENRWENVGWYKYGPVPGQQGSAVIDGHLDRPGGKPAVFWRLRELRIGDKVMVINAQGKTLRFRVIETGMYKPQEAPLEKIFRNTSGAYLNLITCAGEWIPEKQETSHRYVVYTVFEP